MELAELVIDTHFWKRIFQMFIRREGYYIIKKAKKTNRTKAKDIGGIYIVIKNLKISRG